MIYTPDRQQNPPSFYEREETIEVHFCSCCEDEILFDKEVKIGGKHYCGYCVEHGFVKK